MSEIILSSKLTCETDIVWCSSSFLQFRWGKRAVNNATDKNLKELNLTAKEDIISLPVYPSLIQEHQEASSIIMLWNRNWLWRRLEKKSKVKERSLYLGCFHFQQKERKYVQIKAKCGGGTLTVKVTETCNKKQCLKILEKHHLGSVVQWVLNW